MRLRVRGKDLNFIINLDETCKLENIFTAIEQQTKRKDWRIFHKFPPIELKKDQLLVPLKDLGIENAETLTIESSIIDLTQESTPTPTPQIILKEIPDDNSCLFNAIGYVLEDHSLSKAPELRNMIAQYILARPQEYTEAVLGKSNRDYVEWIQRPQSWGGAIELSIFSEIYSVEIASFDVQSGRMYLFGEGKGLQSRIYLQYTGIHYETFALSLGEKFPKQTEITTFDPADESVLNQVREIVNISRQTHRFTDLSGFTLLCDICKTGLKGQLEAQKHAAITGHASFVEY